MRVIEHIPDRPTTAQPHPSGISYSPFRVVPLGRSQELHIDISTSATGQAVSARFFKSKGHGRPLAPERPMHLFPEYLPDLIEALTKAAAAIAHSPDPENPDAE